MTQNWRYSNNFSSENWPFLSPSYHAITFKLASPAGGLHCTARGPLVVTL